MKANCSVIAIFVCILIGLLYPTVSSQSSLSVKHEEILQRELLQELRITLSSKDSTTATSSSSTKNDKHAPTVAEVTGLTDRQNENHLESDVEPEWFNFPTVQPTRPLTAEEKKIIGISIGAIFGSFCACGIMIVAVQYIQQLYRDTVAFVAHWWAGKDCTCSKCAPVPIEHDLELAHVGFGVNGAIAGAVGGTVDTGVGIGDDSDGVAESSAIGGAAVSTDAIQSTSTSNNNHNEAVQNPLQDCNNEQTNNILTNATNAIDNNVDNSSNSSDHEGTKRPLPHNVYKAHPLQPDIPLEL